MVVLLFVEFIKESDENIQTYQRNTIDLQNYENNKMVMVT